MTTPTTHRNATLSKALACIAVATLGMTACRGPHWTAMASNTTYAVILTVQNGNEYVVDHGLTLDDCKAMIEPAAEWEDGVCVRER